MSDYFIIIFAIFLIVLFIQIALVVAIFHIDHVITNIYKKLNADKSSDREQQNASR